MSSSTLGIFSNNSISALIASEISTFFWQTNALLFNKTYPIHFTVGVSRLTDGDVESLAFCQLDHGSYLISPTLAFIPTPLCSRSTSGNNAKEEYVRLYREVHVDAVQGSTRLMHGRACAVQLSRYLQTSRMRKMSLCIFGAAREIQSRGVQVKICLGVTDFQLIFNEFF